jgi:hypothetical protein
MANLVRFLRLPRGQTGGAQQGFLTALMASVGEVRKNSRFAATRSGARIAWVALFPDTSSRAATTWHGSRCAGSGLRGRLIYVTGSA